MASRSSTPRVATTRPPTTRTRPAPGCRCWPRARSTSVDDVTPTQHFTEPPPRFTEATLIKALEEHGIGRPSTYAATISTITDRGYVRVEERRLHPEPVAEIVTDFLVLHFGAYVDLAFTARMEEELDEVAQRGAPLGAAPARVLRPAARSTSTRTPEAPPPEATDEVCSLGHPMVIKLGRNGRFLACSLYPEHKETPAGAGRRAAAPAWDRRGLPRVRAGDPREQERSVRAVRRLLALSRVQVHQEGRPAASAAAAVRGPVPQERGRTPGPASRAAHRERLLGVLELPDAAITRPTTSRSAACTMPTTGRWRARARSRCA